MLTLQKYTENYNILLGSKSPRRRHLLTELGLNFTTLPTIETDESFPPDMNPEDVPAYLSIEKAITYKDHIKDNALLITADTIVCLNNEIIGKPLDKEDAKVLLHKLSGKTHYVISGVCLTSVVKQKTISSTTKVKFNNLTTEEIDYYVNKYSPLDKAGAYGIQEWIGYIGIESINGSYYNVMGLPIQKLYSELSRF